MTQTCKSCGQENPDTGSTCIQCGRSLADATVHTQPLAVAEDAPLAPPQRLAKGPASSTAGSAETEKPLWAGRASYKATLDHWLVFAMVLAVALVLLLAFGRADSPKPLRQFIHLLCWLVIVPPGLWLTVKMLYLRWAFAYRLTEQRLFVDRGIITRTTDQLELIRVDDIRVRQGLLDRLLGLGDVIVVSTDATDGTLVVRGIDKPHDVAELIRTQMRQLRGKGLYIESL